MKTLILLSTLFGLASCSLTPSYQTPYSVEDPTIKGEKSFAVGKMITSTNGRYWATYTKALAKAGFTGADSSLTLTTLPSNDAQQVNKLLWKEGTVYARTLCSDFFRRVSRSKSFRDHAKSQTNIAGGVITGLMGLADVNSAVVGGTGTLFSSVESSFDAYNSAFLVTPDLGLIEKLVREKQKAYKAEIDEKDTFEHVTDVIQYLNEYVYPCTFTGMHAILDESLNRRIQDFEPLFPISERSSGTDDSEDTGIEEEEDGEDGEEEGAG